MPSGSHSSAVPHRLRNADLQPPPVMTSPDPDREPTRQNLASWWKNFKRGNQRREDDKGADVEPQGIFGVPLQMSVKLANVAISLYDNEGKSYIYGYVPIVVAKCGVFLKEKATDIEGIFRLSGSEKRIKELRQAFNTPERYGKGLDWTGYTVHDAANILRRYFNQLPEPIIPLEFYERFREPIRNHQPQAVGPMDGQSPAVGDFNPTIAIKTYQQLITELPALNRQLLLYILDLLAVFASKSDLNKMTTPNLSAIFQPGILSHPTHSMSPNEYRLSQDVLIFLIENQDHFLIGMQGTAADAQTVKDVESRTATPSAQASKGKAVNRSSSAASKLSGIRRSVSASSRRSKGSAAPSPLSPSTPGASGLSPSIGVSRSNTVPSKRGSAATSRRLQSGHPSEPSTPEMVTPPTEAQSSDVFSDSPATPKAIEPIAAPSSSLAPPQVISPSSSEDNTPLASPPDAPRTQLPDDSKTQLVGETPKQPVPETATSGPSRSSAFTNFLNPTKAVPADRSDQRKPNKLQKKRAPSPVNPTSAQSSRTSVNLTDADVSQSHASPLPSPGLQPEHLRTGSMSTSKGKESLAPGDRPTGSGSPALIGLTSVGAGPRSPSATYSATSRGGVNPDMSPANSLQSHSTATGDELDRGFVPMTLDNITDRDLFETSPEKEKEKRRRWFSRGRAGSGSSSGAPSGSQQGLQIGSASENAQRSRTSFGSGSGVLATGPTSVPVFTESMDNPTISNVHDQHESAVIDPTNVTRAGGTDKSLQASSNEGDGKDTQKNPIKWIQSKIAERAEKREEREKLREFERAKSPPADQGRLLEDPSRAAQAAAANAREKDVESSNRGKSFDIGRNPFGRGDRGKSIDVPRQASAAPKVVPQDYEDARGRSQEATSGARSAISKSRTRTASGTKPTTAPVPPTTAPSSVLAASKASASSDAQAGNTPDPIFRLDPAMAASVAAANVSQAKAEMRSASMSGPSPATVAATAAVNPSGSAVAPLAVVAGPPASAVNDARDTSANTTRDELRDAVAAVKPSADSTAEKPSA